VVTAPRGGEYGSLLNSRKTILANTFRVIDHNQQEAIERADDMLSNDILAKVLALE
jgi:hypothetical protein